MILPSGKTKRPLIFYLFVVWPLALLYGTLVGAAAEITLRLVGARLTPVAVLALFVAYLAVGVVVNHYEEDNDRADD